MNKMTQNTKRRPRFKIAKNPPSIQITDRDIKLLNVLYRYRLLTTTQIQKLVFTPPAGKTKPVHINSCRRRLAKLFHNRFVNRLKIPYFPNSGTPEMVYVLDKNGVEILSRQSEINTKQLLLRPANNRLGLQWVDHAINVSQVRITIEIATRNSFLELREWLSEYDLNTRQKHFGTNQMTLKKIPDGYFVIYNKERKTIAGFFLEVDRGTESYSPKIVSKIQAYYQYCFSGQYQRDFGLKAFRVLFVVNTASRLESIVNITIPESSIILATSMYQIRGNNPLADNLWRVVGKNEPVRSLFTFNS